MKHFVVIGNFERIVYLGGDRSSISSYESACTWLCSVMRYSGEMLDDPKPHSLWEMSEDLAMGRRLAFEEMKYAVQLEERVVDMLKKGICQ